MKQETSPKSQTPTFWQKISQATAVPLLAIGTALLLGAILIILTAPSLMEGIIKVGQGYWGILQGALLRSSGLINSLVAMSPLILTGLAVAIPFRAGLFNIGGEGQFVIGSLLGTIVAVYVPLPPILHLLAVMVAGFIGGAIWGWIPGYLRARLGSHEVINTIMLNFIAIYFVNFMVRGPIKDPNPSTVQTLPILPTAELSRLVGRLHWGVFVALLVALVAHYFLFKTTWGFSMRTTGLNPDAAAYAGISPKRQYILAMVIGGGLAGLAGVMEVQGLSRVLPEGFASGYGFDAIAVSLLAQNGPLAIIPSALIFAILRIGGDFLQMRAGLSVHIVSTFNALILLFVANPSIIRSLYRLKQPKEDDGQTSLTRGWGGS